jgi:FixJ family two-component response regulator
MTIVHVPREVSLSAIVNVIDDDASFRAVIARILKVAGYRFRFTNPRLNFLCSFATTSSPAVFF